MSEPVTPEACECPPPTPRAPESPADPRAELLRAARALAERYSPKQLSEYLRLRRSVR